MENPRVAEVLESINSCCCGSGGGLFTVGIAEGDCPLSRSHHPCPSGAVSTISWLWRWRRVKGWKFAGSQPRTHKALRGATPMVLSQSAHTSTRRPKKPQSATAARPEKSQSFAREPELRKTNKTRTGRKPTASSFPFVATRYASARKQS